MFAPRLVAEAFLVATAAPAILFALMAPGWFWTWLLSSVQTPDYRGVLFMGAFGAFAGLWFWLYLWVRQALAATPTGHETPVPPSPQ